MLNIARRSLRLWFLPDNPSTDDKDALKLFIYDVDSEYYARHGRRHIEELVGARSFTIRIDQNADLIVRGRKRGPFKI